MGHVPMRAPLSRAEYERRYREAQARGIDKPTLRDIEPELFQWRCTTTLLVVSSFVCPLATLAIIAIKRWCGQ